MLGSKWLVLVVKSHSCQRRVKTSAPLSSSWPDSSSPIVSWASVATGQLWLCVSSQSSQSVALAIIMRKCLINVTAVAHTALGQGCQQASVKWLWARGWTSAGGGGNPEWVCVMCTIRTTNVVLWIICFNFPTTLTAAVVCCSKSNTQDDSSLISFRTLQQLVSSSPQCATNVIILINFNCCVHWNVQVNAANFFKALARSLTGVVWPFFCQRFQILIAKTLKQRPSRNLFIATHCCAD